MRNNIGYIDKSIRMLLALVICLLVFTKTISGTSAIVLFIISVMLLATCLNGNCPFYRLLGINTKRNLNDKAKIYERNQAMLNNYHKNYKEMFSITDKGLK
jgi:hypothetical protein